MMFFLKNNSSAYSNTIVMNIKFLFEVVGEKF